MFSLRSLYKLQQPIRYSCKNFSKNVQQISKPKRIRKILKWTTGGVILLVPVSCGTYYTLADDISKRKFRVTVEGVGRFFRYLFKMIDFLFNFASIS